MAWPETMVPMLRIIINDYGDSDTDMVYSDSRLEEILVVAAMYVQQELEFTTTYIVTMCPAAISPDPVESSDEAFTNLTVMKAACLTDQSTFRTKALISNIRAKCGPVVLDTLKYIDPFKQLLEIGPCASYESLKKDWMFGNGNICRAILSPFVGNNFDPRSLVGYGTHCRERYFM